MSGDDSDRALSARQSRVIAYFLSVIGTFSLGVTEIFAPWYAGKLGGSEFEIGLAMGSFGIVYMVSPIIGGRVSDRIGRKKALLVSIGAYVVTLLLYPQPFVQPVHLIIIRGFEGLFFGLFYPTIEALVAELSPDSQAKVLGNFSISWSLGMTFSPGAIAFMVLLMGNVSIIYVVLAMELVSLGVVGAFVKEHERKSLSVTLEKYPTNGVARIDESAGVHTSPRFIASYFSIALFGFTSTTLLAFFPSYIEGTIQNGTEVFGLLLMVWNVSRTLGFIFCGRLSHSGMGRAMVLGSSLIVIGMLVVSFTLDIALLVLAMITIGFGVGLAYLGALYSVVSFSDSEKGKYAGLIESLAGVGFFIGPIAAGYVARFSITAPYLLTATFAYLSLFVIALLIRNE